MTDIVGLHKSLDNSLIITTFTKTLKNFSFLNSDEKVLISPCAIVYGRCLHRLLRAKAYIKSDSFDEALDDRFSIWGTMDGEKEFEITIGTFLYKRGKNKRKNNDFFELLASKWFLSKHCTIPSIRKMVDDIDRTLPHSLKGQL